MDSIRVSIVIPTKNEGKYIGPTIAQFGDYFEKYQIEVIVSDAGSTDQTAVIVRQYADAFGHDRVKLVQSDEKKQNIAIGRNAGAAAARGDVLFHMDADVRIPDMDRFFTRILAKFDHPRVVAATTPLWIYPEESRFADKFYHVLANAVIRFSFWVGVFLAKGECQIVRRSAFEQLNGYNENIVAGEDCDLFYRLHRIGKIWYFPTLRVYHSPRRFRKYGYLGVLRIYIREAWSLLFRHKSYSEEWEVVR